jgi:hypothetical protein
MKTNKRCPKTGRFLPRQPRTVASMVAEHNATIREARICRALDLATSAVLVAGLVALFAAYATAIVSL